MHFVCGILCHFEGGMVFDATFNKTSVISWVSFIGGGNRSTRRKCYFGTYVYGLLWK